MRTDMGGKVKKELDRSEIVSRIFFIFFDCLLILYAFSFLYLVFWALTNAVKDSFMPRTIHSNFLIRCFWKIFLMHGTGLR